MTRKETKTNKKISFSEMRKEWRRISRKDGKARTFLVISLIIFIIFLGIWIIDSILGEMLWTDGEPIIPNFVINIISTIMSIWTLAFTLDLINWIDAKIKNFWNGMTRDRIWKGILCSILTTIFIIVWLILLIIPWIIVSVRLKFALYAIIDKWLDPIEAIKYSWNITKWHFREIIWFEFYFLFFNIIWMLCLIVWLIRTWPMAQLATARYYKLLSEIYEEKEIKTNKKSNNISM